MPVRSWLDTGASGGAGKDNPGCTVRPELDFKTGTGQGTPWSFCQRDIAGLPAEFREKAGPSPQVDRVERLLDAARSTPGQIDQDKDQDHGQL